ITFPSVDYDHGWSPRRVDARGPYTLIGEMGPLLDSAQKGTYDLGLPLSAPAGPVVWSVPDSTSFGSPLTTVFGQAENHKGLRRMSTFIATADHAARNTRWHIIDADGRVLGRIATAAARLLQGKHKP